MFLAARRCPGRLSDELLVMTEAAVATTTSIGRGVALKQGEA
jgi:hypothetical protein